MRQIILIFSLLLVLASCNNDDSETSNLKYSEIVKGDHFNGDYNLPKSNLVIKDQETWSNLLPKINSVTDANYFLPYATIDFTKYQLIVVIDKVYSNGGHSIDITKVTQQQKSINVTIENLEKGDLTTRISRPFHVIQIAKTNKNIVFKQLEN